MKFTKLVFVSVLIVVLVLCTSAASNLDHQQDTADFNDAVMDSSEYSSAQGRWLLQNNRTRRVTCKKFPGICDAKGSPGPQCCKKKCVNILTDRHNCGKCGKKCKYNEICCKGKCVNPSFNRKHCGGCNNRCSNGEFCVFGLCNYA